jgi:hypothetical protein
MVFSVDDINGGGYRCPTHFHIYGRIESNLHFRED